MFGVIYTLYVHMYMGSFSFEKRESCPGCMSLPCHVNHSVWITASLVVKLPRLDPSY